MISPRRIRNDDDFLYIDWEDNSNSKIKLTELRYNCPCAYCENARKEYKNDHARYFTKKDIEIADIAISGKYAVAIAWADGHNTGFYEFDLLRRIAL